MATLTYPLSRIEGHAQVVIEIQGAEVVAAHFAATEFRGFEHFVQGVPAEQMRVIAPRICGVCSTAHHVASVKALEDAYDVSPPPLARKIRELMLLAQIIQNQATSLFIFTMPDRLGLSGIFHPSEGDGPEDQRSGIASRALQVRKAGTDLLTLAGGQFIHPVKAVVGGVTSGIDREATALLRGQFQKVLPVAQQLFDYYWEISVAMSARIGTWGDDSPAHYLVSVGDCCPNYDGELIRVMSPDGRRCDAFPARELRSHLTFQEMDYSFAVQTTYGGQVLRANSLARINMAERMGTELADQYLRRFRGAFGSPAHAILLFDLCRGIELVYALERAMEILEEPLDRGTAAVPHAPRDGEGYGLVEAPRGPLIHHYRIEKGLVASASFIIPTVHNSLAIERALRVAAERHIGPDGIDIELERAVGRVVRAFDPCIACATH